MPTHLQRAVPGRIWSVHPILPSTYGVGCVDGSALLCAMLPCHSEHEMITLHQQMFVNNRAALQEQPLRIASRLDMEMPSRLAILMALTSLLALKINPWGLLELFG
jgi:hypothetical protein